MNFFSSHQPHKQKWESQRSRRRWNLAVYTATAVFLLTVSAPLMKQVSSGQPATGGQSLTFSILLILGGFIVLALWAYTHKR